MKLVTFNIRCDYEQDGMNCFSFRQNLILKKLQDEKPDIICFQEVLPHVAQWLKAALPDYYVLGCGRTQTLDSEQMCIAYKKEVFQLLSMDTFWLSKTPYLPGSRYEDQSDCPRTATTLLLQDLSTKMVYFIVNTHLDHMGSSARLLGMSQVLTCMKEKKAMWNRTGTGNLYMLLAGDFNAFPDAPEILAMQANDFLCDLTAGMDGTFHDYGKENPAEKIDYIAATKNLTCTERRLYTDCVDGVYLSDHYPVMVEVKPTV